MSLPYVDPNTEHGRIYRLSERLARSRIGRDYGLKIGHRVDPVLYRVTRGRYPSAMRTIPSAPLLTTGARTGRPREVQLTYFHDGPDPILIASNGGGAGHPHWYYNLKANPDCRFGDQWFTATEVIDLDDYARLYTLAEQVNAAYADYREVTAAMGRRIPLFRLTRP